MSNRYLTNVVSLMYDPALCTGCRRCIEVCPHAVFALENKKAEMVDRDACMECGACSRNCAAGAITVRAGVGCAWAVINGKLRGTEPDCGCAEVGCC